MGLTLTILQPKGASFVLGDSNRTPLPDAIMDGFLPSADWTIYQADVWRAAYAFEAQRFNLKSVWNFTVHRTFNNNAGGYMACSDYIGQMKDTVPPSGELEFLWRAGGHNWVRYIKSVLVKSVKPVKHSGINCTHAFALQLLSPYTSTP
jgi:hypothetical protein